MPFGLKNVGVTYQCLVNKVFKDQIGHNMEVYIDDMLVNSQSVQDHIADLQEIFDILYRYKIQLNLGKCAFRVAFDKFLGFMVFG